MPPFNRYKMPAPVKIQFEIIDSPDCYGLFLTPPMRIQIDKSRKSLKQVSEVLHHEMIHLLNYTRNPKSNDHEKHDERFDVLADEICELYGYNRKTF